MPTIRMIMDGDKAWEDLRGREGDVHHLANDAPPIQVAVLAGGMASGLPSVAIRIDLPNGQFVIAETSARLFCSAARSIEAKYPDLFKDN